MKAPSTTPTSDHTNYAAVHADIVALLEAARRAAARSVNAVMTATYWSVRRHIVEFAQGGQERAANGEAMIKRLGKDLTVLPDEKLLAEELNRTRRQLEARRITRGGDVEGDA